MKIQTQKYAEEVAVEIYDKMYKALAENGYNSAPASRDCMMVCISEILHSLPLGGNEWIFYRQVKLKAEKI